MTVLSLRAEGDCLMFTGHRLPTGYGTLWINDRKAYAHRTAWEMAYGPIPDGMCVCHHCDNPPCCNVDHLFLGTHADNVADMIAKGRNVIGGAPDMQRAKTHCPSGHAYTGDNLYVDPSGGRRCRICKRETDRARRAAS